MSHSHKSSLTSSGTGRDKISLSIDEELIRLTPGLDTAQLGKASHGDAMVTSQLFEVPKEGEE